MKKFDIVYKIVSIVVAVTLFSIALCAQYDKITRLQNERSNLQSELYQSKEVIEAMEAQLQYELEVYRLLEIDLAVAEATVRDLTEEKYKLAYMGDFKLTYYCTDIEEHICSEGTNLTATGTKVTPGRTIAVDPTVIPYGTQVYIEGHGWYVAEDCGGAVKGSHIDIAVDTHEEALFRGTQSGKVWLLIKKLS